VKKASSIASTRTSALALALVLTLNAGAVRAGTTGPDCQAAPSCQALFEQGIQEFQQSRFEAAIASFQKAFADSADSRLLVFVGRAHFKQGRAQVALEFYRRAQPNIQGTEDRARLEQFIREAEGVPVTQVVPQSAPPPPQPASSERPTPSAVPSGRRFPIAGVMLGGGAVALAIAGGAAHGIGISRYNELLQSCAPLCSDDLVQSSKTPYYAGVTLIGVAAAAAVAAAVVIPVELGASRKNRENESQVALGLGPASIALMGGF